MLRISCVALIAAATFGVAAAAQPAPAPVTGTTGTIGSPTVQGSTGTDARTGMSPGARTRVTGNRTEPPGRVPTAGQTISPSATTTVTTGADGRVAPLAPPAVPPRL